MAEISEADPPGSEEDPLAWARDHMPVLASLATEDGDREPFDGFTVAVESHLEANTGMLIETLWRTGARVLFCPSEPMSTHSDVVAYLDAHDGIEAFAEEDMSDRAFREAQHALLEQEPDLILGDGADLVATLHADHPDLGDDVAGGTEQTTAGVERLEAMAAEGILGFPAYSVNDTPMKRRFDNVHGTGESALANIAIITNTTLTGKTVVIAGYGYVGRGIASKARGIGAHTVVTEVDPRRAIEAHMDGHRVLSMAEAAEIGDLFVTATGSRDVLRPEHVQQMQDDATLCNAGHFDVEIDLDGLMALAQRTSRPRPGVARYHLPDGRRVNLLTEGRLVNLTGPYSSGHPAEVMDTTFAMIYVAARDLLETELPAGVHGVPDRLDRAVADRKLETLDVDLDKPNEVQREYAQDWRRNVRF